MIPKRVAKQFRRGGISLRVGRRTEVVCAGTRMVGAPLDRCDWVQLTDPDYYERDDLVMAELQLSGLVVWRDAFSWRKQMNRQRWVLTSSGERALLTGRMPL